MSGGEFVIFFWTSSLLTFSKFSMWYLLSLKTLGSPLEFHMKVFGALTACGSTAEFIMSDPPVGQWGSRGSHNSLDQARGELNCWNLPTHLQCDIHLQQPTNLSLRLLPICPGSAPTRVMLKAECEIWTQPFATVGENSILLVPGSSDALSVTRECKPAIFNTSVPS